MPPLDDVTLPGPGDGGSTATVDNPPSPETTEGTPDGQSTETTPETAPTAPDIWRELGHDSPDDLKAAFKRHREQISGSQREVERLRQQSEERDRQYQQQMMLLQNQLIAMQAPKVEAKKPPTLAEAITAWTDGDNGALMQEYDQSLRQAAVQQAGGGITPEKMNELVDQRLASMTKPAQYADYIGSVHPELRDQNHPVYAAVFDGYDDYVAKHGAYYQFALPQDPAAIREVPSPDGYGTKRVDLRIIKDLAAQVKIDRAKEEGRLEEFNRRTRPTVSGQPQNAAKSVDTTDHLSMFSRQEQDAMSHMIAINAVPPGWPNDLKAMAKYRYEKLPEGERERRKSQYGR